MFRQVWAEIGQDGRAVRIFKNMKAAVQSPHWPTLITFMFRWVAVEQIRRKVFDRDGHECTHCSKRLTWDTMQMHERQWKGRGGEVSLDNCTSLCYSCHQHDEVAGHGKRQIKWSA